MLAEHWLRHDLRIVNPLLELLLLFDVEGRETLALIRIPE